MESTTQFFMHLPKLFTDTNWYELFIISLWPYEPSLHVGIKIMHTEIDIYISVALLK